MCIYPHLIKNPNRGRTDSASDMVDTKSQYIPVPCGHCVECIRLRSSGVLQRAQLEEQFGYPFMISLSYNPESLAYYECSNGYKIPYAPVSDVQNMLKRIRKSGALTRPFRYFAVTELGSKKGRPHAHLLCFLQRQEGDSVYTPFNLEKTVWSVFLSEWRRNYGSTRNPVYKPLCTYVSKWIFGKLYSTYDCHYVTPSVKDGTTQDVSFYVTKYLCKDSKYRDKIKRNLFGHLSHEEAQEVWNRIKPRSFSSLNFGFGYYGDLNPRKTSKVDRLKIITSLPSAKYVRDGVLRSAVSEKTGKFYDIQTGKSMPLARYWYKFGDIYDVESHRKFLSRQDRIDGVSIDERSFTSKLLSEQTQNRNFTESKSSNLDLIYGST